MFLAVECYKLGSFRLCFYDDVMTLYHVGIKAVHGLSVSHHDIIGDVYDVVDGAQTDGAQFVLQPFRTLFHFATCYRNTRITFARFRIFYRYVDGQIVVVYHKRLAVRAM